MESGGSKGDVDKSKYGLKLCCRFLMALVSAPFSFIRHRYFLCQNYPYRRDARSFDSTVEESEAPSRMSGSEMLRELDGLSVEFDKGYPIDGKKRKHRSKTDDTHFN